MVNHSYPENFDAILKNVIKDFCVSHWANNHKAVKKLAEMMAGKARLLSEVIEKALTSDENNRKTAH
ncbi:MAG: hypothetical protein U5K51_06475 [Flavobacteriaceae bacterium]|nr:hypothetical protein [Flavobacteriaceae bacterium]